MIKNERMKESLRLLKQVRQQNPDVEVELIYKKDDGAYTQLPRQELEQRLFQKIIDVGAVRLASAECDSRAKAAERKIATLGVRLHKLNSQVNQPSKRQRKPNQVPSSQIATMGQVADYLDRNRTQSPGTALIPGFSIQRSVGLQVNWTAPSSTKRPATTSPERTSIPKRSPRTLSGRVPRRRGPRSVQVTTATPFVPASTQSKYIRHCNGNVYVTTNSQLLHTPMVCIPMANLESLAVESMRIPEGKSSSY